MTTGPNPQIVRQLAREQILNHAKNLAQDDVTVFESVIEKDICIPLSVGEQEALSDDVLAEIGRAQVTASWPDEHATTGRPAAELAHAAEDVRKYLALRARAVNDEVLRSPEVISVARADGHSHALMETVVRTLLAERDALAAYVEAKLAEPDEQPQDDEAQHARTFLADLRENITSFHEPLPGQPEHCTCGGASGCNRGADDLAAIATLEAALNAAAPQYFVDGQPVDRESYEAWADEGRATAGIDYDEADVDNEGNTF